MPILNAVEHALRCLDEQLIGHLQNENTLDGSLTDDVRDHVKQLTDSSGVIVVSGMKTRLDVFLRRFSVHMRCVCSTCTCICFI